MKTIHSKLGTILGNRRLLSTTAALFLLLGFAFAPAGFSQTAEPLGLSNNYMVTGDYVVGGVGLRGLGDATGFAKGTINIPDPAAYASNALPQQVPDGADIVAAFLYWETVESSGTFAGRNGFFRGYPISGAPLGNPNAPVSWSSGGCAGSSQGSKTMVAYRADVSNLIPIDSNGNVQPNTSYEVRLVDGGKSGNVPFTLGATLVIVYRTLAPTAPLTAVVIYDGAYAPSNSAQTASQRIQGFFQAGNDQAGPIATKITHIVGNGQSNKFQQVFLNNYDAAGNLVHSTLLPSLYGTNPSFPGNYNGSWDNPTWFPNSYAAIPGGTAAVQAGESSETAVVVPASTNKGCVSWGAMILSTTVQDSDHDGLLDVWKTNQGYCDAGANRGMSNQGTCPLNTSDPSWVALPNAHSPGQGNQDVFIQLDYMCSMVNKNSDGTTTCNTSSGGVSYKPSPQTILNVANAFSQNHSTTVHIIPDDNNVILAQPCTDNLNVSPPQYCAVPGAAGAGIVGWKAGYSFLKTQPLNYSDELSCETRTPPGGAPGSGPLCLRRFQPGKNNSYHEVVFGVGLVSPNWSFIDGSLTSVTWTGNTVTFNTSSPHGLVAAVSNSDTNPRARVTVSNAISNPSLNGTYLVSGVPSSTSFTIQIATSAVSTNTYTSSTDPVLAAGNGIPSKRSGISDIGGSDSLVTLGLWGADGQTDQVQSGTFMHEVGHSFGLTHGGFARSQTANGYAFTFGPNCKSNYQSVMNYMFQVDLLNGAVDYSDQVLNALNEKTASNLNAITNANYQTTQWYTPTKPITGSPATSHCDGTAITLNDTNPTMYRVQGPTTSISWLANQDINFDGTLESNLEGFNDWDNLDLRQIGATGNDFWSGGGALPTRTGGGALPTRTGGGALPTRTGGGTGGEITIEAASSVVRSPSALTATLSGPNTVTLTWAPPTFGQSQIAAFNIYRSSNGAAFSQSVYATVSVLGTPLPLPNPFTFVDAKVSCATFSYFVTTVLTDGRESVPSNIAGPISVPCTFVGFLSPLNTAGTIAAPTFSGTVNRGSAVPIKWELFDANGNAIGDLTTLKLMQACPTTGSTVPPASSTVPPCVLLYSPTTGAKGNSTFRFSSPQFIFNWDTKSTIGSVAGYFTIELTLTDGSKVKATTIQFQ